MKAPAIVPAGAKDNSTILPAGTTCPAPARPPVDNLRTAGPVGARRPPRSTSQDTATAEFTVSRNGQQGTAQVAMKMENNHWTICQQG